MTSKKITSTKANSIFTLFCQQSCVFLKSYEIQEHYRSNSRKHNQSHQIKTDERENVFVLTKKELIPEYFSTEHKKPKSFLYVLKNIKK